MHSGPPKSHRLAVGRKVAYSVQKILVPLLFSPSVVSFLKFRKNQC